MIDDLRIHARGERSPRADGNYVLYWMQSSLRADDNHALAFAINQANRLRVPLLVYHRLGHDYPWASDGRRRRSLTSVRCWPATPEP